MVSLIANWINGKIKEIIKIRKFHTEGKFLIILYKMSFFRGVDGKIRTLWAQATLRILLRQKSPKTPKMYWYVGIFNIEIKKYVNISNIKM